MLAEAINLRTAEVEEVVAALEDEAVELRVELMLLLLLVKVKEELLVGVAGAPMELVEVDWAEATIAPGDEVVAELGDLVSDMAAVEQQ